METGAILYISGLQEDLIEPVFTQELLRLGVTKMPHIRFQTTMRGQFKGTAILSFQTLEEAKQFKKLVNYKLICNKICFTTFFLPERTSKDRKFEKCNLFIKLPEITTSEEVEELLSKYGEIFSLKIRYNKENKSQGYGYISFMKQESAEATLKDCEKGITTTKGIIHVFEFKSFKERNPEGLKRNNLLVKNIDPNYTDAEFKDLVSKHGTVTSAIVAKETPADTKNRGFGFACFGTIEAAEKAMKSLNEITLNDKQIVAVYHLKKSERKMQIKKERLIRYKDKNVFVKNIPTHINDADLVQSFSIYGKVTSARVFIDKNIDQVTGKPIVTSKGFGFVCFDKEDQAAKMIADIMVGKKKFFGVDLYAAIPESKGERIKRNKKHFRQLYPMYPNMPPTMHMQGMPMQMQGMPMPMPPMPPMQGMQGMQGMQPMPGMQHISGQRPMYWDPYNMPMPMPHMMMERPMMPQFPPMPMPMPKSKSDYEQMEKNQLGEIIYERIMQQIPNIQGDTCGKITGMILEMEKGNIAEILISQKEFDSTVQEGLKTLNKQA